MWHSHLFFQDYFHLLFIFCTYLIELTFFILKFIAEVKSETLSNEKSLAPLKVLYERFEYNSVIARAIFLEHLETEEKLDHGMVYL